MNNSPASRSRARRTSRFATCAWVEASSADTASSAMMIARVGGEGAGDGDALALPTRELERVAAGDRPAEAHLLEHLRHAPVIGRRVVADTVEPVGDLSPDPAARVERRVRVLEDHLHPSQLGRAGATPERRHVGTEERHVAARPRHQPDGGAGERRLAAPRLADEADHLTGADLEVDADHRVYGWAMRALVADAELAQLQGHADPIETSGSTTHADVRSVPVGASAGTACVHRGSA